MKRLESFASLGIAVVLQFCAAAQEFSYTITNGDVIITKYNGSGGNVVIPSTFDNLPVTTIGDYAFFNQLYNLTLTSVSIPSGVTSIGAVAFSGCIELSSVTIPDTVTSLGEDVFSACWALTSAIIGNGVTSIPINGFGDCSSLTNVVIGAGVRSIGQQAFDECHLLTDIALPDTLTNIGPIAFRGCSSLTNLIVPKAVPSIGFSTFGSCISLTNVGLPDGLLSIGDFAFAYCTNLTRIMIPMNVTNIGLGPFYRCLRLAAIEVDARNPAFSSVDGVLFNKTQTELIRYPPAKTGKYWIQSSVTTIAELAFDSYGGLTSVLTPRVTPNNGFGFTISWPTNASVVIEATSNLIPPIAWSPVSTNTLSPGLTHFSDPQWTNYPAARFYRLRP